MMRLWKLLALPFFLGLLILAGYLYYYLGAYKEVEITIVDRGEVITVGRAHRGAYHQINSVIVQVEEWAKANSIGCQQTFGEYLDNPQQVEEARLKSIGGCVLEEPLKISALPDGLSIGSFPAGQYVHATFTGSPAIGPWKVYPKLMEYVAQRGLKTSSRSIELYKINADGKMTTEYLFLIIK